MAPVPRWTSPHTPAPPSERDRRSRGARLATGALILLLVISVGRLQILRSSEFRLQSEENRLRAIYLPAPRGILYDRNGTVLAENVPTYSVSLLPQSEAGFRATLEGLSGALSLSPEDRERIVREVHAAPYLPVRIAPRASLELLSVLEERRDQIPGLVVRAVPRRFYPYGPEVAHVVGYVGEITGEELAGRRGAGYRMGDFLGRGGVERQFEERLRGQAGAYFVEVDALGRELGPYEERPPLRPRRGEDLTLTLDLDLQRALQAAFPPEKAGGVVALDPRNGEILALLSCPSFDPNAFAEGIAPSEWRLLATDLRSPLYDRVVQAAYPPGSTFKLVTALLGLQEGLVTESSVQPATCAGGYQYGRRWFGCWRERGHGHLDLTGAIIESCDTYFYQLGARVGLESFSRGARACGFGAPTEIDLPNEVRGFVPSVEWYNARYGKWGWGRGVALNLAIGQGELLVSPLQLACFYAALANGGTLVRPHLVRQEEGPEEAQRGRLPANAEQLAALREALVGVVSAPRGTGHAALAPGLTVTVAGKTGTAQNPHGEDHAWFVGFAPAESPEILIAALVEEAGHGGSVAAPLVGQGLSAYFEQAARRRQLFAAAR